MRSPNAEGYFVYGSLDQSLTRAAVIEFLTKAKAALDELVRKDSSDTDVADVVVAFSPRLLGTPSTPRFSSQVPSGFAEPLAMPGPIIECDLLFYIASLEEERVANFVRALWDLRPSITEIAMDRGYQRKDGTEVFGYADGLRNVEKSRRSSIIFVHEDRHPEEPSGVVDGSYMAFIRIEQHPEPFQALEPAVRDAAMGRTQDGTRLDLPSGRDPRKEPAMPAGEPPPVLSCRRESLKLMSTAPAPRSQFATRRRMREEEASAAVSVKRAPPNPIAAANTIATATSHPRREGASRVPLPVFVDPNVMNSSTGGSAVLPGVPVTVMSLPFLGQ